MRYYELDEGKNTSSIVVDIQPQYEKDPYGESNLDIFLKAAKFLNRQKGPILMLVNADAAGQTDDTIPSIKHYWEKKLGFTNWNNVTINDKGYGYLRSWMDADVSDAAIIKTIRLMYQLKIADSGQLFGGPQEYPDDVDEDVYDNSMTALLGNEYSVDMRDDTISVEWTSLAQLKRFNGSYIFGGGCYECLKEVQLLMNAFNIKYKVIHEFVYGRDE